LFLLATVDPTCDQDWEDFLSLIDEKMYRVLWREAYRICRNAADADDILQESLIRGGRHFHQLRDPDRMLPWMFTIVRREAYRVAGKKPLQVALYGLELALGAVHAPSPDDLIIEQDLAGQVRDYLETLDPCTQQIIRLRQSTDLTLAQIAKRLGLPQENVKSRYYRARKQIEALIREEGGRNYAL